MAAARGNVIGIKKRASWTSVDEALAGYLFVLPMLIGITVLTIIPILAAIAISFTDWNFISGFSNVNFVGIEHFARLLEDEKFMKSLLNNLLLLIAVPVTMALSLLIAVVINKQVYFKDLFKVIYFMPYISSVVAISIVWQLLFHPSHGPINSFLMGIGIHNPPRWMADPDFALISIMLIMIWISIGFNLVIYMAGLQNIPRDLYEAASIDGANALVQFRKITLPMLSPTSFFLLVTGVIATFKVFDLIMVLTGGGPAYSTSVINYYIYEVAFEDLKSGYASAMSLVLLLCVLAVTLLQWIGQKRWVNY
ncbi:sugar ABC transporter permease [Paenibacillus sp. J5C_2022]|uniref:carbohydrate ABC transporter permease n=1 Tax=Paenibacillus sp. J5C2022 TaxID=2977129 RepID=UPI0021D23013|nr:sugar ABC transporter permease [Paenibacillus sp. J5C2022]MCU6711154.1 sugar ABC transporter permease [Paenibacillus sp. J5C2022]